MSVRVVDGFEMIDISHENGNGLMVAPAASQFTGQNVQNHGPVPKAGQRVTRRLMLKPALGFQKLLLKVKYPHAGAQPSMQFIWVDRFYEVVIGARIQAVEHLLFPSTTAHQNDILVRACGLFAKFATNVDAVHSGHEPIKDRKSWTVRRAHYLPCLA